MLIDSHCHLDCIDLTEFNHSMDELLDAAHNNDVSHFLCVSIELDHYDKLIELAERYPQISISAGVHPNTEMESPLEKSQLINLADHPDCIAIGETGLDYYRNEGDMTWQQQRFATHIDVAIETGKPLIIHTRQASDDTIAMMKECHADKIGGVMHCFSESWEVAKQALDLGFYISFSGIVTFKNAKELQQVAKKVPLDRMLIETDSPYLAPTPFRGKQNHPALVKYVASYLSQLLDLPYDQLAKLTTDNFNHCFRLANPIK